MMTKEEKLERLARQIFATLYTEEGYGETNAWNEAYRRASEFFNK